MHNYKKHYQKDGDYILKEYRENGKIRVVGEDNSSYLEFIKNNIPEEIVYIEPELITPPTPIMLYSKLKLIRRLKGLSTAENPIYTQFRQLLLDNDVEDEFFLSQEISSDDSLFLSMLELTQALINTVGIDIDNFLTSIELYGN